MLVYQRVTINHTSDHVMTLVHPLTSFDGCEFSALWPRNGRTPNPSRSTMHLPKTRRAKRRGSEMAVRLLLQVIIMVLMLIFQGMNT